MKWQGWIICLEFALPLSSVYDRIGAILTFNDQIIFPAREHGILKFVAYYPGAAYGFLLGGQGGDTEKLMSRRKSTEGKGPGERSSWKFQPLYSVLSTPVRSFLVLVRVCPGVRLKGNPLVWAHKEGISVKVLATTEKAPRLPTSATITSPPSLTFKLLHSQHIITNIYS